MYALISKPDVVVEVVLVDPDSSVGSEAFFFLSILLNEDKFLRVNCVRFARGSLLLLSLSIRRFRDCVVPGACPSCEQVCVLGILSMAKESCSVKENVRDFYHIQAGRQNDLFTAAFVARGLGEVIVGCGKIPRQQGQP